MHLAPAAISEESEGRPRGRPSRELMGGRIPPSPRGRPLSALDRYGWLPGPPWLLHDAGLSSCGPVHWPLLPAPLPPLVGGCGLASTGAAAASASEPASVKHASFFLIQFTSSLVPKAHRPAGRASAETRREAPLAADGSSGPLLSLLRVSQKISAFQTWAATVPVLAGTAPAPFPDSGYRRPNSLRVAIHSDATGPINASVSSFSSVRMNLADNALNNTLPELKRNGCGEKLFSRGRGLRLAPV
jgi:hypothetical protein